MKKLLVLLLLLVLYGCQTRLPSVHVFLYDGNDPFIDGLSSTLETYGKRYFEITIHDAQNSQIIQNELIVEALDSSPDLLIVNPVDRLGAYTIIEKVKQKDIPIIFFNREPLLEDLELYEHAYYVGSKAEESAIFQAEIIHELFGENPNLLNQYDRNLDNQIQMVIFKGEQGHQDAELRTSTIQSALIDLGYGIEVIDIIIADWNETKAYNRAQDFLETHMNSLELIVSNNDAMALGVIKAMEDYHEAQLALDENYTASSIPVIGIDGITSAIESIEAGTLFGTVINDSFNQAIAIVELGQAILADDFSELSYELTENYYIWIPYKKLT
jgi:methyl-galactoside transport system substrate-binding protein